MTPSKIETELCSPSVVCNTVNYAVEIVKAAVIKIPVKKANLKFLSLKVIYRQGCISKQAPIQRNKLADCLY